MIKKIVITSFIAVLFISAISVSAVDDLSGTKAGITPDSSFYIFDKIGEWFRLNAFTFSSVKKAEIKAKYAEERLAELKVVIEKDKDDEVINKSKDRFIARLKTVTDDVQKLDIEGKDISELVRNLSLASVRHQGEIKLIISKVKEDKKQEMEDVLEVSRETHRKSENSLLSQSKKGNISEAEVSLVIESNLEKLRGRIDSVLNELDAMPESKKKQKLEEKLEREIEHLEERILKIESEEDLKEFQKKIDENNREISKKILEIRKKIGKHASSTEEALGEILNGTFSADKFDKKAAKDIEKAQKELTKVQRIIDEATNFGAEIPPEVSELVSSGVSRIDDALVLYEDGQSAKAVQEAKYAKKILHFAKELIEEVYDDDFDDGDENEDEDGDEDSVKIGKTQVCKETLKISIEQVEIGEYDVLVGGVNRGSITVLNKEGEIEFKSEEDHDKFKLDFNVLGSVVEVENKGVLMFSTRLDASNEDTCADEEFEVELENSSDNFEAKGKVKYHRELEYVDEDNEDDDSSDDEKENEEEQEEKREKEEIEEEHQVCIDIYDPVCGEDENTYSNECKAEVAGVSVSYKGECEDENSEGANTGENNVSGY